MVRSVLAVATLTLLTFTAESALSAQSRLTPEQQITASVLPLPANMRDGAGVLGYRGSTTLVELRPSKNGMLCLADDPADERFHVACYHQSMDPFMARGRALRAAGVKGAAIDSVRYAEVKSGKIKMPTSAASLYQLFGPKDDFDPKTGTAPKSEALFVVYMPFATEQSTGLSTQPSDTKPWLMLPGTPKAHIMFSLKMN
jgi:hypothetical protein